MVTHMNKEQSKFIKLPSESTICLYCFWLGICYKCSLSLSSFSFSLSLAFLSFFSIWQTLYLPLENTTYENLGDRYLASYANRAYRFCDVYTSTLVSPFIFYKLFYLQSRQSSFLIHISHTFLSLT